MKTLQQVETDLNKLKKDYNPIIQAIECQSYSTNLIT